jgi:FtsZ-binding cell division protein ZapB
LSSGKLLVYLLISTLSIYAGGLLIDRENINAKLKGIDLDKKQKKELKNIAKRNKKLIVLGIIIGTSIGVYAINASEIDYNNTKVDQALDTLYETQNTTVTNLTSQNQTLTQEKSELQSQLNSLTTASRTISFTSNLTKQTFNTGFKPDYVSCVTINQGGSYIIILYNKDFDPNYAYRITSSPSTTNVVQQSLTENARQQIEFWFSMNANSFVWNIDAESWNGLHVYCTLSK